jgi:2-C-methyl-D-erythritol 2,4-cyclodiphosphate synthase
MQHLPVGHRIGIGYDVHAFADPSSARPLVLGGVTIPGARGLMGHSDADVLVHAICDAILGALALGDLGTHFPDDDLRYKGVSSLDLLRATAAMAVERGWRVRNIDTVVVAEEPKIAPFVAAMRDRIASGIGIDPDDVSVKGTRPEGLGALGRREGIAAQAIALLASRGALSRLVAQVRRSGGRGTPAR